MESAINDFTSCESVRDPALLPLSDEASLLRGGILDSLSLLRLVIFLEERLKGTADRLPGHFDDVNPVRACLRAREPGKHGTAHG
jgi:hypothetical protein